MDDIELTIPGSDYSVILPFLNCDKTNLSQQDFHLLGTAFENRFWGDQDVIRYETVDGKDCRIVNKKLIVDYALDWIFKNKK